MFKNLKLAAFATMAKQIKRGAFIVFEGCDRSGKSTQSKMLLEFLQSMDISSQHMAFPARQSRTGQVIDAYLTKKEELTDECIHLLFSANRWEFRKEIEMLLNAGTTLVVDRYSYSGVAYSAAKGLDFDWCMAPEKGLIRPDIVYYLSSNIADNMTRKEFGQERYENNEFQQKVSAVFEHIYEQEKSYWHKLDAGLKKTALATKIADHTLQELSKIREQPLQSLP